LDPAEWKRVEAVLDEVLDLPPDGRGEAASRLCEGDAALQARVAEILEAVAASESWLGTDAPRLAARWILSRSRPPEPGDPPAR
jgi:hypothetical protein